MASAAVFSVSSSLAGRHIAPSRRSTSSQDMPESSNTHTEAEDRSLTLNIERKKR